VQGLGRDFRESAGFRSKGCAGAQTRFPRICWISLQRLCRGSGPICENLADFALKAVQGLRLDFRESAAFRCKGCAGAHARFPRMLCSGSGAISKNLLDFALKAVQGLRRDFQKSAGFRPKARICCFSLQRMCRGSGPISENLLLFALKVAQGFPRICCFSP